MEEGGCAILKDTVEIYTEIIEVLKKRSVVAISDDFNAYAKGGREKNVSKLLLVDQADYDT